MEHDHLLRLPPGPSSHNVALSNAPNVAQDSRSNRPDHRAATTALHTNAMEVDGVNVGDEDWNMGGMEMESGEDSEDDDERNYEDFNDNEGPDQSECPFVYDILSLMANTNTLFVHSS